MNYRSKVQNIIDQFDVSTAIFRGFVAGDKKSIQVRSNNMIKRYDPSTVLNGKEPDTIEALVISNYDENFITTLGKFAVSKQQIMSRCDSDAKNSIIVFLEKNMPLRSPRQSKVYKFFYRNLPNTPEMTELCYSLYNFMLTFCDSNFKAEAGKEEYVKTTLALLEAIQEKYGRDEK